MTPHEIATAIVEYSKFTASERHDVVTNIEAIVMAENDNEWSEKWQRFGALKLALDDMNQKLATPAKRRRKKAEKPVLPAAKEVLPDTHFGHA